MSLGKETELLFSLAFNCSSPCGWDTSRGECHCQLAFPLRPLSSQRVVAEPGGHKASVLPLWLPPCQTLLHQVKHQIPSFVSSAPDFLMLDTLSLPWQILWAYAFLPFQLLTKILTKLRQSNVQLLFVVLARPAQPWSLDHLDLDINR